MDTQPGTRNTEHFYFLIAEEVDEGLGVFISGDDSAVRQNQGWRAGDPKLFGQLYIFVNRGGFALGRGQWLALEGIFKQGHGLFADNGLRFAISRRVNLQRKHLVEKSDIFSFLNDLL